MNRFSPIALSIAAVCASLTVPFSLQPMPGGALRLNQLEAVASQPLLMVQGNLGPEHEKVLSSGRRNRATFHAFRGRAGQPVSIALTSPDFSTVVALVDTNTNQVIDVARGTTSNNSSLQARLPYSGSYLVMVSSLDEDAEGRYQLSIVPSR